MVLVLFAVGAFALAGLCVAGIAAEADSPEGMAAFAFMVVALMATVLGLLLLVAGLVLLVRRIHIRPAWLVDPADRGRLRWWDGERWTDHTNPRSPDVVALAPLVGSNRPRRRWGAGLVVGGILVAVASDWVARATVVPATEPDQPSSPLPILAMQLVVPALAAAVLGLFLVLTLADEPHPAWHPDPLDPERLRWWDGLAWTDATTPR
jgi:hypothetical protein